MSYAKTHRVLAEQRQRYARTFRVPAELVETEAWEPGEGKTWCPTRPDLPVWTLNRSEAGREQSNAPRLGPKALRKLVARGP